MPGHMPNSRPARSLLANKPSFGSRAVGPVGARSLDLTVAPRACAQVFGVVSLQPLAMARTRRAKPKAEEKVAVQYRGGSAGMNLCKESPSRMNSSKVVRSAPHLPPWTPMLHCFCWSHLCSVSCEAQHTCLPTLHAAQVLMRGWTFQEVISPAVAPPQLTSVVRLSPLPGRQRILEGVHRGAVLSFGVTECEEGVPAGSDAHCL